MKKTKKCIEGHDNNKNIESKIDINLISCQLITARMHFFIHIHVLILLGEEI